MKFAMQNSESRGQWSCFQVGLATSSPGYNREVKISDVLIHWSAETALSIYTILSVLHTYSVALDENVIDISIR